MNLAIDDKTDLKLVASAAARLDLRTAGLIAAANSSLAGNPVPGLQFQTAIEEISDSLAHIDDVWYNPATGTVLHAEPLDSEGFVCYSRSAIVEALVGPRLSLYLP
jgi:hypothetical protein